MFKSARLKLTLWYLLIIMMISVSFSIAIYFSVSREMERGFRRAEMRYRAGELGLPIPQPLPERLEELHPQLQELRPRFFSAEDISEAKRKVALRLLMINGAILIFSSVAGYFLAGKTLQPIEETMEEQKRFVADASHELRTPLTALKTSIEVALRCRKRGKRASSRRIRRGLIRTV